MPKITTELRIRHVVKPAPPFPGGVHLTSLSDFWEIADLGFDAEQKLPHAKPGGRLEIRCPENDPRLPKILRIIARSGYTCSSTMAVGKGTNQFYLKHARTYTPAELDAAELLTARPDYPHYPMAELGELGDDDTGWQAVATTRIKKNHPFGHFDCLEAMVFSEPLKLHLETVLGLTFHPIPYNPPSPAARALWQLAHHIKLPPCLLPRVTQTKEPFTDENQNGAIWDEGGYYHPVELRFPHSAIAAMGTSHAATTQEKIGPNNAMMISEVIVTQRFRTAMAGAKVKGIEYTPVRLE